MVYRKTARSARVREDAQRRLLAAARKLFAERGYDATTMQEVVREARTSIGNAYFYFPSKDELLRALLQEATDAMWRDTEALAREIPRGTDKVAAVLYANMRRNLGRDRDLINIAFDGVPRVVTYIVELRQGKVLHLLIENYPKRSTRQLQMAAAYLVGGNRNAMEQCVSGRLDVTGPQLSEFLVSSNLRVLGISQTAIKTALRKAVQVYESSVEDEKR